MYTRQTDTDIQRSNEMPKRLKRKDCVNVYTSYLVGKDKDGFDVYTETRKVLAQVTTPSGNTKRTHYGNEFNYDIGILFEKNDYTIYVNEDTRVWVGISPNTSETNYNYIVNKIDFPKDGLITAYCSSQVTNSNTIWYSIDDENIYSNVVEFDVENLTVVVPSNFYFPVDTFTKIWYREPRDAEDTSNLIVLTSSEEIGNSKKFVFEVQNA